MSKQLKIMLTVFIFVSCQGFAWAGSGEMGLSTGSKTGSYIKIGRDIKNFLAISLGIDLAVIESQGSMENVRRLVDVSQNTMLAIVQSDVLNSLKRHKKAALRETAEQLRLIYPLYNEVVHVLVRRDIQHFSELDGKNVNFGKEGSGTAMTAGNLFELVGIQSGEETHLGDKKAFLKLLEGEIDAMFYVGGTPNHFFLEKFQTVLSDPQWKSKMDAIHFLPLDDLGKPSGEYVSDSLKTADYPWLKKDVPTLAVKALLVTLDFSTKQDEYHRLRCRQMGQLARALKRNLDKLKKNGEASDKWQQVKLEDAPEIWQLDGCAHAKAKTAEDRLCEALYGKGAKECQ
ncbi:TAXI family TRAP transporter solute-binding subunit [Candidatus Venteria ishoeyi]|uniref:NMT1/THI5 like protein n=1 Tax=Candidatus Venteria ishoeyi TaxID=1899563 RepID=A0A1H6F2V2_9GAMM|nr:TAXI family TRAP transporter solute-binding subunit [Candidatus Venteria ishoeyi]SEH04450.1 Uncharacterised protein [Candidatus Venteria ishoeyi]